MKLRSRRVLRLKIIKQKREALGLTFAAAAKEAGMYARQEWYAIESGANDNPTLKKIKAMAKVLKCKAGELIDE